tara:strand:- start:96 stop:932 length:837 start_codon:yes stop_codon:yes gene_type:complete
MSIALLSISFILIIFFFSNRLIQKLQENVPFKIILNNTSSSEIVDLMNFLKTFDEVDFQKTQFVEKELAATKLKEKLGADFLDPLNNENPLPDVINLYVKSKFHNSEDLKILKEKIEINQTVSSAIFPLKVSDSLMNFKLKILNISFVVCIIFMVLSIILIYNNIRLKIFTHSENLKIMQLVGATKNFIQKPYLLRSLLDGLFAAIISNLILAILIFTILFIIFEDIQIIMQNLFLYTTILEILLIFIVNITFGILISFLSHFFVLKKILSLKINFYR